MIFFRHSGISIALVTIFTEIADPVFDSFFWGGGGRV